MAPVGGSIESVVLNGRRFSVTSDADSTRDVGGFSNANENNGDGTSRLIKTRVSWEIDGLNLSIDDSLGDQEFLQNLADANTYFTCLISYASGISFEGQGQIMDGVKVSSNTTSVAIKLGGNGVLTRQT